MNTQTAKVIFQPSGRRGRVPLGISLVEASRLLGEEIEAPCGEKQVCGKCKIRIAEGVFEKFGIDSRPANAGPWNESEEKFITAEEKAAGFRLGCVARVTGDLLVFVPETARSGKQVVSKTARRINIDHDPAVKRFTVRLTPPTLADPTADFERLTEALERDHGLTDLRIDLFALRQLGPALRSGNWEVTVSIHMEREIIGARPGPAPAGYGLAIDVGTTTVAAYLCRLDTGDVIDTVSMMNPQVKYGEDVVSRISYHMGNPDGLSRMSADLVAGLNDLVRQAVESIEKTGATDVSATDIEDVTICCNTAMHHILLQIDPEPLGTIPFTPAAHHSLDVKARDLGLAVNPAANIFFLPSEAGFVGGDNVGVLLAEEPHKHDEIQLIIDIGTNGELVLGNRHQLISSSCATGPALEGAQIEFGMRAAPGAIERVNIDPDTHEVDYKVIGRDAWRRYSRPEEMKAKGICGSGILDVLGEMLLAGVVLKSGAFNKEGLRTDRFRKNPDSGIAEFVLAWAEDTSIGRDIVITQKDIRQIQLAKASIYCGCKLMIRKMNLTTVDKIKIAGAFGTHVDRKLAMVMGLFPDAPLEAVSSVGNAAGDGCRAALLDRKKRLEADRIARQVTYMELTMEDDFQQQLVEATQLPHMTDLFPHLEGVL